MIMRFNFVFTLVLITITAPAFADYTVFDNGEILPSGHYKFTGHTQHLTDAGGGLNAAAIIDMGFSEDWGARGFVGFGHTDIFFGALAKWMPIKEEGNRPAMGFNFGFHYLKDSGTRDFITRVEPLISKKIEMGNFWLTPYGSIPIGVRSRDSENGDDDDDITSQFVIGSQLQIEKWKNLQFIAEIGIELNESPSYVGAGAILYFDSENGFTLN